MKIITLIFLFAGFWVNAQEKMKIVYVAPVSLNKEISLKKAQARLSTNILENTSTSVDSIDKKINTNITDNPRERTVPNNELNVLNKANDTINKYTERKYKSVVKKNDSEN